MGLKMKASALPLRPWTRLGIGAGIAIVYFAAAQLGLSLAFVHSSVSPVWPPTGIAIAAVVLLGAWAWPGIFIGAVAANLVTSGDPTSSLFIGVGNTLEGLLGGLLVRRFASGRDAFRTAPGVFRFTLFAAILAPLVSASIGVASLLLTGMAPAVAGPTIWFTWYLGDATGALIVAPVVILIFGSPWPQPRPAQVLEWLFMLMLVTTVSAMVFARLGNVIPDGVSLAFLVMPVILWAAFRLGPSGAAVAAAIVSGIAVWGTVEGSGPFAHGDPNTSLLTLQAFVSVTTLVAFSLAALVQEQRRVETGLEDLVANRTAQLTREARDREEAELKAKANAAKLAAALQSTQDAITVVDVNGHVTDWNDRLQEIWHFPDDMLARGNVEEMRLWAAPLAMDPTEFKRVLNTLKPAASGDTIDVVRLKDGRVFERATRPQNLDGRIIGRVISYHDVTFHHNAQEQLAASNEKLQNAQQIAHIGSWEWDIAGDRITWSDELHRIFGQDPATAASPNFTQYLAFLHPEDRANAEARIQQALADGKPFAFDHRTVRPDGTIRIIHGAGRVEMDASGRPIRMSGTALDITEQREIADHLRVSNEALVQALERFKVLADASPVGIYHTSAAGDMDYANRRWSEITGCADQAAAAKAVHPDDVEALRTAWRRALGDGAEFEMPIRFVRSDSVRDCVARARPVRSSTGAITGYVGTLSDVTVAKAAEGHSREIEALRQQAEFKTTFLRTAAHELGNPLTPLKIQMRLLRDMVQAPGHAGLRHNVEVVDRNVERLALLVHDMLDSARLQAGRLSLTPRPVDLSHIVHEVLETFQQTAIDAGIALDLRAPVQLPLVADPDRLSQVLYNLLSNAMKFTSRGGHVHIDVSLDPQQALIQVRDSGAGFSPEQEARLFQPFGQVHDAVPGQRGTGLGLYISKGIIEQHGGELTAHSDGPGHGAVFAMALPLVAKVQTPQVEELPREM